MRTQRRAGGSKFSKRSADDARHEAISDDDFRAIFTAQVMPRARDFTSPTPKGATDDIFACFERAIISWP